MEVERLPSLQILSPSTVPAYAAVNQQPREAKRNRILKRIDPDLVINDSVFHSNKAGK